MKLLFVSSECMPFVKTGGLGEIVHYYLKTMPHYIDTIIQVLPYYRAIRLNRESLGIVKTDLTLEIPLMNKPVKAEIYRWDNSERTIYFIGNDDYFDRDCLYSEGNLEFVDNAERFLFFNQCIIALIRKLEFYPDIVHCIDWQCAMLPVYLRTLHYHEFIHTKIVLTINNLLYQGIYSNFEMPLTNLPWSLFNPDKLEFYGKINFLKGGIVYADAVVVPSPQYLGEIQTREQGCGLHDVLQLKSQQLFSIINGIEKELWNPQTDPHLEYHYSADDLSGKQGCKRFLLNYCGFEPNSEMVCAIASRIIIDKGLYFFLEMLDFFMRKKIRVIMLGVGDRDLEQIFKQKEELYPDGFRYYNRNDIALGHQILAGSDILFKPSLIEPGGLSQIYALECGTIPVVSSAGGLMDTVLNIADHPDQGNGFWFKPGDRSDAERVLSMVQDYYYTQPSLWKKWQQNAMNHRLYMADSVKRYIDLYHQLLTE
ncbi:MAG: glycogen/starch synthase [Candidatus Delongbacteria bacterium]|nr:glycogen/starch synthase [Candidatus Delongbacteria bacterium]